MGIAFKIGKELQEFVKKEVSEFKKLNSEDESKEDTLHEEKKEISEQKHEISVPKLIENENINPITPATGI